MRLLRAITVCAVLILPAAAHGSQELSVDLRDGLPQIHSNSLNLVSADFVFWDANWKWSAVRIQAEIRGPGSYFLRGSSRVLGIEIDGNVRKKKPNQLAWTFNLTSTLAKADAIGGGIIFKLDLDAMRSGRSKAEPELLPDNTGWRLRNSAGDYLTVRFDMPVEQVFFERGQKSEIRAFFYKGSITPGHKQIRMTVTLPENGRIVPTLKERLGPGPDKNWYQDILYWATSPVDLSYLNEAEKPAGKRGFLRAEDDALIFEDGTKAQFWGINLMASALFRTNSVEVKRHAKRLSRLGFNLVRIHHHDSSWVRPNVFGNRAPDTLTLDNAALKKLDWWIKALRDEGIYVWLDLNVGREFTPADRIDHFDEIAKGKSSTAARGFTHINDDLQILLMKFQENFLGHINSFTSLAYKDDPAVVAVLVTNENDITNHFGNSLLPNKNVPHHNAIYMMEAKKFAVANNLAQNKTWRSWEHGPAKIFLNDLEHRFNTRMLDHLDSLAVKVPAITTQSWGRMPLSSLPALSDSDIIDVHSYGGPNEVEFDPRYRTNLLARIAAAQVSGKPLSVSEWNSTPFPAFDRSQLPLQMAAMAGLQAWDALMQYGYAQVPLNSAGGASNWHAFNDPASLAMMPAAALMFRRGHVREAEKTYALKLDPRGFYYRKISSETSVAIRTIAEQSRLVVELPETPELPWLKPAKADRDAIIVTDPDKDFLPAGQSFVRSDTGEIYRNWEDGIFTINTEKSQLAAGWLGGKSVILKDISVELQTINATIAVQSLTDQPVRNSDNILISLSARSVPSSGNKLPFWSEPVVGTLTIMAREGLQLFALDRAGKEKPVPVKYDSGRYVLELDHKLGAYWLKLHAPGEAEPQ